jgi:hypothetical protein
MVKQARSAASLQRSYYGFRSFNGMLEKQRGA